MPITQILPPNRLAVIATVITSLAAFIAGLAKAFPGSWESYALAATGLLGQVVATLKFLEGSQKFDALQARERLEHIRRQGAVVPAGSAVTTFEPPSLPASRRGAYVAPSQDE